MYWFPWMLCALAALAAAQTRYLAAPEAVRKIIEAPAPATALVSPSQKHVLLLDRQPYPPIAELAQPILRLAGHRINPRNNALHNPQTSTGATLVTLDATASRVLVSLPSGARIYNPAWNGPGDRIAVALLFADRAELWVADMTGRARPIPGVRLNAVFDPFEWGADGKTLFACAVPAGRPAAPRAPGTPPGPNVQETRGKASDTWTFQDLLASPHDEDLFDYYATSQLMRVDTLAAAAQPLGKPGLIRALDPSPDGKHLLVTRMHRPYSWLYPSFSFPREVEVWDTASGAVKTIASLPLADAVSQDGVRTGPRPIGWKPGEPAALVWVEAMDGGNPKEKVPHRDRIMVSRPPFERPEQLHPVQHRFQSASFLKTGNSLLVTEVDRDRRWVRTLLAGPGAPPKVIEDRGTRDRYSNPGDPILETLATGKRVVRQDGDWIFFESPGSGPKGDYPMLTRLNLNTLEKQRIFQSEPGTYESVLAVLAADGSRLLTQRESPTEPPNLFIRHGGGRQRLTDFRDPAPEYRQVTKRLVTYKRADGVPLSFTLYLPPGYKEGTRLPTIVWAYPLEFNDPSTAGQVTTTENRFTIPRGASHLFLLLAGYAILDNASLPIVGDVKTANDTFVEQIVSGAKAAIDKAVELGVTDRERAGVSGHSYGGFMTANLLAHSDLFQAGVARSGAYNRTLTPFGFQGERRTFWQAPETYARMSPFMHAHKINEPILFLHGMADNNSGTFPVQSERMYQAVRGNGGAARLVMLPHELHGYAARESVEHAIAETIAWFDTHVKNRPVRRISSAAALVAYPKTRKVDQVDDYHGVKVSDPYRWLEDDRSAETAAWVREQNQITFGYLNRIPYRGRLRERLTELANYPKQSPPFRRGESYFFSRNDGLQNQPVWYVQKGLDGKPELLIDPNQRSAGGTTRLTIFSVSKDARYLAFGLSQGGSDWQEIRLMDLATRKELPEVVRWIKGSGAAWRGDGFYYSRYPEPEKGKELTSKNENQAVYYHRAGTPQSQDELVYEDKANPLRFHNVRTTDDERFALLYVSDRGRGKDGNALFFRDDSKSEKSFRPLFAEITSDRYFPLDHTGGRFLVQTNRNAPNWKVVEVDPADPAPARWRTIIPEKPEALEGATSAGGRIFAQYLKDANSRVHVYTLDGRFETEVPLPGIGSVSRIAGKPDDRFVFYTSESFAAPDATYRYEIASRSSTLHWRANLAFPFDSYETKQVFYPSKDGTRIPLFLTHRKGLKLDGRNPVLLRGYGGFNVSEPPQFNYYVLPLLEQGGVYASACLRGGAEYGEKWHQAGMKLNKQNVFDDFIAAAEYLIREKYTSPDRLAIWGRSNGGLLVGAVMNQRPELFGVAIPEVGVMDMLRFQKFTIGWNWIADYGSSGNAAEFRALYAYSPLHNIRARRYPATLITTADHDDRVVPGHSFKYAATLQEHNRSGKPALIRIETMSGHGSSSLTKQIEIWADLYAFLFENLNVQPAWGNRASEGGSQ